MSECAILFRDHCRGFVYTQTCSVDSWPEGRVFASVNKFFGILILVTISFLAVRVIPFFVSAVFNTISVITLSSGRVQLRERKNLVCLHYCRCEDGRSNSYEFCYVRLYMWWCSIWFYLRGMWNAIAYLRLTPLCSVWPSNYRAIYYLRRHAEGENWWTMRWPKTGLQVVFSFRSPFSVLLHPKTELNFFLLLAFTFIPCW